MIKLILSVILFPLLSACFHEKPYHEQLSENLSLKGQKYFEDIVLSGEYETILEKIESGDINFIKISGDLVKNVDASSSTALRFSLSRALTKSPLEVLSLVPNSFSVSEICTIPYIEVSTDEEMQHVKSSILALSSVSDNNPNRASCLNIYKKIEQDITGQYSSQPSPAGTEQRVAPN